MGAIWAWIEALAFSALAIVRGIDAAVETYLAQPASDGSSGVTACAAPLSMLVAFSQATR